MRRPTLLVPVLVLALALLAQGAVLARTFTCTGNPCEGTRRDDEISGTDNRDRIYAKDGADFVDGNGGNDTVYGGRGGDDLVGEDGDDELFGGAGGDTLTDGRGDDDLYGGEGNDHLYDDNPFGFLPADTDRLFGGPGDDKFTTLDGDGLDTICTGPGANVVEKDAGDRVNPASCP